MDEQNPVNQQPTGSPVPPQSQPLPQPQSQPEPAPVQPVTQQPMEQQTQEPYDLKKKEAEVESKKKKFMLMIKFALLGFLALVILIATAIFGLNIYNKNKKAFRTNDVPPDYTPIEKDDTITDILDDELALYKSDLFKLSLEYPERAKLTEKEVEGTNPQKLVISHDDLVYEKYFDPEKEIAQITKELPEITDDALERGFIFKVTLLDLPRNLDEVVRIKAAAFKSKCPDSAVIGEPYGLLIDEVASAGFRVDNCGPTYKVFYVPRFGIFYEIQQIFAGDLGFKSKFEAISDSILNSVDFYLSPEEIYIEQPYTTKIFDNHKFTIRFSSDLTEGCCATDIPVANQSLDELLNMGKPLDDGSNRTDKITIFGSKTKTRDLQITFDERFQEHQNLLINDYKLVTGNNADTKMTEIDVNGLKVYKLEGYSWQGYDLYYFTPDGRITVVIVVDNKSGDDFQKYVDEMIRSIEVF